MNEPSAEKLRGKIADCARELGFDLCKITSAHLAVKNRENLEEYVNLNHHGSMSWMEETLERRGSPDQLWPEAKSVIMLAMNYGPDHNPLDGLEYKNNALISVYARNRDYHDVIKGKLKTLASKLASWKSCNLKVFVDTAPIMEKPLAGQAGIGWQGKHTNLVSREFGSWLFLGSIFTDADLIHDQPEVDHCGSCSSCLDICPTNAFPAPYQIDARRCISYLTIENKGMVPLEFRKPMGNRIYGCDDCLSVCPWNKFAQQADEAKLQARADLQEPEIGNLLDLDDPNFRKLFSGSPVKRIGRDRFIRNVLIAAGNSGNPKYLAQIVRLLDDEASIVRASAIWALKMLGDNETIQHQKIIHYDREPEQDVQLEWETDPVPNSLSG